MAIFWECILAAQLWETVIDGTGTSDLRTCRQIFHFIKPFDAQLVLHGFNYPVFLHFHIYF